MIYPPIQVPHAEIIYGYAIAVMFTLGLNSLLGGIWPRYGKWVGLGLTVLIFVIVAPGRQVDVFYGDLRDKNLWAVPPAALLAFLSGLLGDWLRSRSLHYLWPSVFLIVVAVALVSYGHDALP